MKKTVKFLALALVAMSLTVACNNQPATEDTIADTTPIEEMATIETIDTTVAPVEEVVAEEPVKKTVKKEEKKVEENKVPTLTPTDINNDNRPKAGVKTRTSTKVEKEVLQPKTLEDAQKPDPSVKGKKK